jgi:uncharacterized protein YggT (Ycf19 family)
MICQFSSCEMYVNKCFFLRYIVTEPYLKVFRSQIPPIGGFDISAIPALFCLDILSQAAVAIGKILKLQRVYILE